MIRDCSSNLVERESMASRVGSLEGGWNGAVAAVIIIIILLILYLK